MNIEVNDKGIIELREVFSGISLITSDGEKLHICMRDSGFEINYQDKRYELKEGKITPLPEESEVNWSELENQGLDTPLKKWKESEVKGINCPKCNGRNEYIETETGYKCAFTDCGHRW